nr:TadE/TadG family type IV pilus assembly protein [Sphingobium sp. Sx8-8]
MHSIIHALRAVHGFKRKLWKNREAAATVEFAIVGPAFIACLLAILYTILIYLAQQMLETAAQGAGRLLLTGAAQTTRLANGNVGMTASDFKNAICNGTSGTDSNGQSITIPALLPSMLSCSRLTVNVTTTTSYNVASTASPTFTYDSNGVLTSTGTGYNYQSGGSGQNLIVVLQLIYLWPTGTGPLNLNLVNQPNSNHMLVATSVFTTENYSCNTLQSQTSC